MPKLYEMALKLIEESENSCTFEESVAHGKCKDPGCGDELTIFFKTEREIITGIGFSIDETACNMAKACASWMIKEAKDKPVMAAYLIDHKAIDKAFGGLGEGDVHCAMMAELALKQAIVSYSKTKKEAM